MKPVLRLLIILIPVSAFAQEQDSLVLDATPIDFRSRENTILSIMNEGVKQWYEGNPAGYAASFAEEITYFDPGTDGKRIESKDELTKIFSERNTASTYEIIDPDFQHSKEFSVLTYQIIQDFKGITLQWNCTEVYAEVDGQWSVIHGHFSPFSNEVATIPKKFLFIGGGVGLLLFLLLGIFIGRKTKKN
ncbi:nuclear transport factor 2 family protein [Ekhidna sp.]|uniref:nuclear transport factor 2 family protein n=1 Tax=Ekhidna sp. TaxID=2608089 RepID=UPI003B5001AA